MRVSAAVLVSAGWATLALVPSAGWLVVFSVLFGLGFGARGPIITAMASERFGGRRFGVIWFDGVVHDATGSYRIALLAALAFGACGAACFWPARRPAP
jgi:MFS family permease